MHHSGGGEMQHKIQEVEAGGPGHPITSGNHRGVAERRGRGSGDRPSMRSPGWGFSRLLDIQAPLEVVEERRRGGPGAEHKLWLSGSTGGRRGRRGCGGGGSREGGLLQET